jgi:hypothetical protein
MIGPGYASAYKFEKGKHEAGKCFFSITCNVHSLIKTKLLLCCWILQNSVPKRAAHALFILQITNKPTCILPVTNLASFKIQNSGNDITVLVSQSSSAALYDPPQLAAAQHLIVHLDRQLTVLLLCSPESTTIARAGSNGSTPIFNIWLVTFFHVSSLKRSRWRNKTQTTH